VEVRSGRDGTTLGLALLGMALAIACAAGSSAPTARAAQPDPKLPAGAELTRDPQTGTVRFLKGPDLSRDLDADPAFKATRAAGDAEGVARAFLAHFAGLWRLDDPSAELTKRRIDVDRSGASHVRLSQVWRGLPVLDAELIVHLDRDRRVVLVNGTYFATPRDLDPTPALDATAARAAAARATDGEPCAACATDLVVFAERRAAPRLAWRIAPPKGQIKGEEIVIDARKGDVLRRLPAAQTGTRGKLGGKGR